MPCHPALRADRTAKGPAFSTGQEEEPPSLGRELLASGVVPAPPSTRVVVPPPAPDPPEPPTPASLVSPPVPEVTLDPDPPLPPVPVPDVLGSVLPPEAWIVDPPVDPPVPEDFGPVVPAEAWVELVPPVAELPPGAEELPPLLEPPAALLVKLVPVAPPALPLVLVTLEPPAPAPASGAAVFPPLSCPEPQAIHAAKARDQISGRVTMRGKVFRMAHRRFAQVFASTICLILPAGRCARPHNAPAAAKMPSTKIRPLTRTNPCFHRRPS